MPTPATPWPAAVSERSALLLARATRPSVVLAAFPAALYLDVDGTVLPVVAPGGLRLPTALAVARPVPALGWGVQPGDVVRVGDGSVRLPQVEVRAVRRWRPQPVPVSGVGLPLVPCAAGRWHAAAHALTADLVEGARVEEPVATLVGYGPGLTPSGDDVLCGVLLGLRLAGRDADRRRLWAAVAPRLGTTTSLSRALLTEARDGYAVPEVVRLAVAVGAGHEPDAVRAVRAVERMGHTSGRDLLDGLSGCLDAVATTLVPARQGATR